MKGTFKINMPSRIAAGRVVRVHFNVGPRPTQKPPIPTLICGREDGWMEREREKGDVGGMRTREMDCDVRKVLKK